MYQWDGQAVLLLTIVFLLFVGYFLFRNKFYWHKILFNTIPHPDCAVRNFTDKYAEKFRTSSLFKASLKILDLEEHEVTHFENIEDKFEHISELSDAIREAGLESSNIIIGVDFTASNEWQGRTTFDRKNLHSLSKGKKNPYQQVITTISTTLSPFDDDKLIPAFGFGDACTKDKDVFSFTKDNTPCQGFEHLLQCYDEIVSMVELSGPTSFVPLVEKAIEVTKQSNNSYHILVIIADGQVEDKEDVATRDIIIKASYYPISIIVVGVGDGPWDNMHVYDEKLPSRLFDNFQFVDYHDCLRKSGKVSSSEVIFALHALMEIPDQYKQIKELGLLNSIPGPRTSILQTEFQNSLSSGSDLDSKSKKDVHAYKRKVSTFFTKKGS